MGRQIPFIKAIMLNSWRQRTWKNLFLFFIHIYNIYSESQRKLHSQIKKKKLCSLCTIRWSEFPFSYKRQNIKICFVQMKFEIYLLCLFTENKELKLNAFLFNRTIYNIHVYGKRRSNCLISLLLSIHCDVSSEKKSWLSILYKIDYKTK